MGAASMADAIWQRIARRVRRKLYRYLAAEVVTTARDVSAEQAAASRRELAALRDELATALRAELAAELRSDFAGERDGTRERFAALETAMQDLRRDLADHAPANARLTAIEIHAKALRAQISAERSAADARLEEIEGAATALFEHFERQGEALGERLAKLERDAGSGTRSG
jgi:chromosome segregation ATPase